METEKIKKGIEEVIDYYINDIKSIRTGRANPAMVEEIKIDYYGTKTPLIQLASISVPEPKMIVIQPFDKNSIKEIEKAINASPLGINPVNEGNLIRLVIPAMTEERRIELTKILHQKSEESKIKIRNLREEEIRAQKNNKNNGKITEDDFYQHQEKIQEMIEEYNGQIKTISDDKEKEIMSI
jgi:ribosome recycling factor